MNKALGYFWSGILFAALMAVPLVGWRVGLNPVAAFWFAYVGTRPLGASFADWFGKPHHKSGGLDFGDGPVTLILVVAIVVLVAYLTIRRTDIQNASTEVQNY